jgi:CheY-like chemotaxis protein
MLQFRHVFSIARAGSRSLHVSPTAMTPEPIDVLVVEDDRATLELTLRALRRLDASITLQVVTTGQEALEYLTSRGTFAGQRFSPRPRLILLDLQLPHLNGLEVLQFLRADPHCPGTPIVLFTSSENPKDIKLAYENGVNAYVIKPDSAAEYAAAVSRIAGYWLQANQVPQTKAPELKARAS